MRIEWYNVGLYTFHIKARVGAAISLAAWTRPYTLYLIWKDNGMGKNSETLKIVMEKLEEYYAEVGKDKDIHYTFGYFDAIAVIKSALGAPLFDIEKTCREL